ncbi:MAG: Na+/H+ antiporter NhaA [Actinomycetes bacterium]
MSDPREPRRLHRVFTRPPRREYRAVAEVLRRETIGGALLLGATVVAVAWASSPWAGGYEQLRALAIGPSVLGLHLSLEAWASDGLLAIFFFVAGVELKRELVVGQLRDPRTAALPVVAAVSGMVGPAVLYLAVTAGHPGDARGWAIPMATDIAFALAVLAVTAPHLPPALRAFLLTLAVVDDLGAILVIAMFYSTAFHPVPLAGAAVLLAAYALARRAGIRAWYVYLPLVVVTWVLVHDAGIHATIAGVALGLVTPARPRPGADRSTAEELEHRWRPVSAGVAVPVFALLAAGVPFDPSALASVVTSPAAIGVMVGLVAGKAIGVFAGTYVTVRFTRAQLDASLAWADVAGVALLAGVGFTVALLIGQLAFPDDPARGEHVRAAVLLSSVLAAVLATVVLRRRDVAYRKLDTGLDAGASPELDEDAARGSAPPGTR